MDVFFNSTFAQSMRGYRLMRLYSDGYFYDVNSVDEMGSELFTFFSEELFKILWFEKSGDCFCCAKGIRGVFNNNKTGYIDFAIKANADELDGDFFASVIFNNFNSVSKLLFKKTTVLSNGDYAFDFDGFTEAFCSLPAGRTPKFAGNDTESDGLKAAVCICSAENALSKLNSLGLKAEKKNMIDYERYEKEYLMR